MDVADLLMGHRPADDVEAGHLRAALALVVLHCGEAPRRTTFEPGHLTASGLVVSPDRASVLLVHHAKLGIWVQPGGHIEAGDPDLESAARREVAEETGLADMAPLGLLDVDVHRIPASGDEPAHEHHDLRFGFVAGSWKVEAGDGAVDVRWVPLADLEAHDPDPGLRRAVRKLVAVEGEGEVAVREP